MIYPSQSPPLLRWACASVVLGCTAAGAQQAPPAASLEQRIEALQQLVTDQGRQIEILRQQLADQARAGQPCSGRREQQQQ